MGAAVVLGLGLEVVLVALGGALARLRVLEVDAVADGLVFGVFAFGGDFGGDEGGGGTVVVNVVVLSLRFGCYCWVVDEGVARANAVVSAGRVVPVVVVR